MHSISIRSYGLQICNSKNFYHKSNSRVTSIEQLLTTDAHGLTQILFYALICNPEALPGFKYFIISSYPTRLGIVMRSISIRFYRLQICNSKNFYHKSNSRVTSIEQLLTTDAHGLTQILFYALICNPEALPGFKYFIISSYPTRLGIVIRSISIRIYRLQICNSKKFYHKSNSRGISAK